MTELFQWVPWFGELAKKVREGRREGLVARAKEVDWAGRKCAVLAEGEHKADPLTFFYHLASIARGRAGREAVYASVAEVFGIESEFDYTAWTTASSFRFRLGYRFGSTTPELIRSFFGRCSIRRAPSMAHPMAPLAPTLSLRRCRSGELASRSSRKSSFWPTRNRFSPLTSTPYCRWVSGGSPGNQTIYPGLSTSTNWARSGPRSPDAIRTSSTSSVTCGRADTCRAKTIAGIRSARTMTAGAISGTTTGCATVGGQGPSRATGLTNPNPAMSSLSGRAKERDAGSGSCTVTTTASSHIGTAGYMCCG